MVIKSFFIPSSTVNLILSNYFGVQQNNIRENCDYTFKSLEKTVPLALNSVSLKKIRKFARRSWRFMDAYRNGLTGLEALYAVKRYKSHRKIPSNVIDNFMDFKRQSKIFRKLSKSFKLKVDHIVKF